jgi:predicted flap endonuclease-1-like 5' DNA nuclease
MTNLAHITETALLLLAAYLLGCVLGYTVRLVLHAGRGMRQVAPAAAPAVSAPQTYKPRSAAARLAARVDPLPPVPTSVPLPAERPAAEPAITARPVAAAAIQKPAPPAKAPKPARSIDPKPATLAQPRPGGPDNLKQIKGIGPKIEASLHAMGIFHIDQIAGWSKANVEWVDAQLSFKGRIRRERWVEQAMELSMARAQA